jgi:alkyl hydroperoxide reductase subunit F
MLDESLKTQLKAYLERLVNPIELVASVDDSAASAEMMALLNDIVAQNGKISLREDNVANVRKPSFAVNRIGEDTGVRFAGLPMGHEFTSLVLALLQVGGYPPKVEADVHRADQELCRVTFNFEVYISLSCHNCPDVVQAMNLMAALIRACVHHD